MNGKDWGRSLIDAISRAVAAWAAKGWAAGAAAREMAARGLQRIRDLDWEFFPHEMKSTGGWYGFACHCGRTGGPWPTPGEAAALAGIHAQVAHQMPAGSRFGDVVPASPFTGPDGPGASRIQIFTAQSGLSVGGGQ